jgi:hypothetical protein
MGKHIVTHIAKKRRTTALTVLSLQHSVLMTTKIKYASLINTSNFIGARCEDGEISTHHIHPRIHPDVFIHQFC